MIPAVVTISYFNYAIIAVLGGLMVLNGQSDLGSLASYLVFVRQSAMPINQLTQQGNFLLVALAGAERIFRTMEEEPEVDRGAVELVRVRREGGRDADPLPGVHRPLGLAGLRPAVGPSCASAGGCAVRPRHLRL